MNIDLDGGDSENSEKRIHTRSYLTVSESQGPDPDDERLAGARMSKFIYRCTISV